jgi:hypothetical protein
MTDCRLRPTTRGRWWLLAAAFTAALCFGLSAGAPRREGQAAEAWTALVRAGDEAVAGQPTAGRGGHPLTARTAYLLAFHEAQDAEDLEHAFAVADRLHAAREPDLAAHVRRAAEALGAELPR